MQKINQRTTETLSLQCTQRLEERIYTSGLPMGKVKHFNYSNPIIQPQIIFFCKEKKKETIFPPKETNAFLKRKYIIDEWQIPIKY